MRSAVCILSLIFWLCAAAPCAAAVCITDDAGRRVCLEKPAARVIPLYAAFTDILVSMGEGGRIVARTNADTHHGLGPQVPSIGTHMRPNAELVLGAQPDLVLQMGGRAEAAQSIATLENLGLSIAFFQVRTFEDLFSVITRVGVLTGADDAARQLVRILRARLDAVAQTIAEAGVRRPSVFFEVRYPNLLGAGPDSLVTDIIRAAGGDNVLAGDGSGRTGRIARLSEEELIRLDPDYYCIQTGPMNKTPPPLKDRPHYKNLRSAQPDRNILVDEHVFSRPGPAAVDAVAILARLLYPSLFSQEK